MLFVHQTTLILLLIASDDAINTVYVGVQCPDIECLALGTNMSCPPPPSRLTPHALPCAHAFDVLLL